MSEPNYDDLYFTAGDQSDGAVVTNTDRTQQTIELVNKIEMLKVENEFLRSSIERQNDTIDDIFNKWKKCNNSWFKDCMIMNLMWLA